MLSTIRYLAELKIDIPPLTIVEIAELFAIIGTVFTVGTSAFLLFLSNRFMSKRAWHAIHAEIRQDEQKIESTLKKEEADLATRLGSVERIQGSLVQDRVALTELTDKVAVISERQQTVLKTLAVNDQLNLVVKESTKRLEELLTIHLEKMDSFVVGIDRRVTVLETKDKVRHGRGSRADRDSGGGG